MSTGKEIVEITVREALSGILGSISLACWVFLLVPQLVENYRNGSAEAISLTFIFVWFIGDICNLAGALWAGLVPVVIAIAVYFCIADGVLIGQCLYYRIMNKREEAKDALNATGRSFSNLEEEEPLLHRQRTKSLTIPGSVERRMSNSSVRRRRSSATDLPRERLVRMLEESDENGTRLWVRNILSILAIVTAGAAGWAIAYQSGAWRPTPQHVDVEGEPVALGASVLGYASAVAYLGARIPQIIKNFRDKSCEGLSLLFFVLSLLGNATYGAGILCHSTENEYVMTNLPWLIGSLGTMAEDIVIFFQFHLYAGAASNESAIPPDI